MPAAFWTVVLLVIGLLLVMAELLLPSGGIISVLATAALVGAVLLAFKQSFTFGLAVLAVTAIGLPIAITLGIRLWSKTPFGRRFFLEAPKPDEVPSAMEEREQRLKELVGRIGVAVTPLRPAGIIELDGLRLDTVTEGLMVDPGTPVRVVRVEGITVVVRPVPGAVQTDSSPPSDEA